MSKEKLWKLGILFAIAAVVWFIPAPKGLSVKAWHLFAIYLSAIVGLVIRPFSEPVIMISAIAFSSLLLDNTKDVLSGYASTTTWMVYAAFALSAAFVSTGLGKRIAYLLIDKFAARRSDLVM